MMKLTIIAITFLFACSAGHQDANRDTSDKSSLQDSSEVENNFLLKLQKATNASNLIHTENWTSYESVGHPDTALALYAYRIIHNNDTTFEDFESHIRLYREQQKVKDLLPKLFVNDTTVSRILLSIDHYNKKFFAYVKREVEAEVQGYGSSDGPLYDFYKNSNGN